MSNADKKSMLVLIRRAPYSSSLARASVDLALAAAAFEQQVDLLFQGDGVLQLLPNQQSELLGLKSIGKVLGSLPLYGIEQVYVDARSLSRYGLAGENFVVPVIPLEDEAMSELLARSDHLVSC